MACVFIGWTGYMYSAPSTPPPAAAAAEPAAAAGPGGAAADEELEELLTSIGLKRYFDVLQENEVRARAPLRSSLTVSRVRNSVLTWRGACCEVKIGADPRSPWRR